MASCQDEHRSNAAQDVIELVAPDPSWPKRFAIEAGAVRAALKLDEGTRLEHFGSTAVPGLLAKPVIDLMLLSDEPERWPSWIEPLSTLGYVFRAENPRRDRPFFVKGMPPHGPGRSHHLHVRTTVDGQAELRFRDILRGHPGHAEAYARLKQVLAARHREDREGYTAGKSGFVAELLNRYPN